jgi:amidase
MSSKSWEDIAKAKRAELLNSIPKEWIIPEVIKPPDDQLDVTTFPEKSGWFTTTELEITSKSAAELLEDLRGGKWTSETVTKAFCKRAAAAHQLVS